MLPLVCLILQQYSDITGRGGGVGSTDCESGLKHHADDESLLVTRRQYNSVVID